LLEWHSVSTHHDYQETLPFSTTLSTRAFSWLLANTRCMKFISFNSPSLFPNWLGTGSYCGHHSLQVCHEPYTAWSSCI